jgi:hypothetical protein
MANLRRRLIMTAGISVARAARPWAVLRLAGTPAHAAQPPPTTSSHSGLLRITVHVAQPPPAVCSFPPLAESQPGAAVPHLPASTRGFPATLVEGDGRVRPPYTLRVGTHRASAGRPRHGERLPIRVHLCSSVASPLLRVCLRALRDFAVFRPAVRPKASPITNHNTARIHGATIRACRYTTCRTLRSIGAP